jgi:hypothetical protein
LVIQVLAPTLPALLLQALLVQLLLAGNWPQLIPRVLGLQRYYAHH